MERIKLNLIPSGVAPVVHCSQYDDGREFAIDLFEGDSVYVLDGTETLTVNVRKPDGHLVTESVANTSDSYVVIATTEQMVAVHGTNYAKLQIVKGAVTIATLEFLMNVSRDPLENGDPSESFVSNLETQIASAVADQYDSNNVIFDNAPTSGHGTPYTVTSEGIKDAIDNAISGLTIPENITDLADVDVTTPTDGEILVYNNGTWENQANPASTANFGPDYDENTTYNTGDKVIYQGLFYVCNDDNVTGTWDATKWDAFTVADLNGKLLPMSTTDPDKVADRIEALETRNNIKYYTTASQKLNSLSWTQSAAGVYYTVIDLSALISDATLILSVSICGWNVIRSSDNITPFINANDKKIGIMANTNSFSSADSSLTFRVIYI